MLRDLLPCSAEGCTVGCPEKSPRPADLRDTWIAGIALARQAQLATRNVRHFNDTGLSLVNPFPQDAGFCPTPAAAATSNGWRQGQSVKPRKRHEAVRLYCV